MAKAKEFASQLNVHWTTIYEYRRRLTLSGEATAIARRNKGWKPALSRLLPEQEKPLVKPSARCVVSVQTPVPEVVRLLAEDHCLQEQFNVTPTYYAKRGRLKLHY